MDNSWIVVDNAFNRANYPDLIGRRYPKNSPPSYAAVRESVLPDVSYLITEQNVLTAVAVSLVSRIVGMVRMVNPHCEGCGRKTEWPTEVCVECV